MSVAAGDYYYGYENNSMTSSYGYGDNYTTSAGGGYNDTYHGYGGEEYGYYGGSSSSSSSYSSSSYSSDPKPTTYYGDNFSYGAMSVAILTLGLVVVVEFVLHRIDHSAIGKPFYQAVLDAVYRERKFVFWSNNTPPGS